MVMSPVHQVWPKPSCKAQWKGEEDKADRGRGGRTTSGNGQALSSAGPRRQWRTGEMEKTGCKFICGAPTTIAVKGLMMMRWWRLLQLKITLTWDSCFSLSILATDSKMLVMTMSIASGTVDLSGVNDLDRLFGSCVRICSSNNELLTHVYQDW